MTLKEIAKQIMEKQGGNMSVGEIAEYAVRTYSEEIDGDIESLKTKFANVISQDIRKKRSKSDFRKVTRNGVHKRGTYKLKLFRKKKTSPPPLPKVKTMYTGKAGELAVLGELLFFGFNASLMTVDDGIDIVASKDNRFYHIQVKTSAAGRESNKYSFFLDTEKYSKMASGSMFYIFVMRRVDDVRNYNDFLVLSSPEIKTLMDRGIISKGKSISLKLTTDKSGSYMLNGEEDISASINKFNRIQ